MSEIVRYCRMDDRSWYSLADALMAAGLGRLLRDPELLERIPEGDRRQIRLSHRWTWMLSASALDLIAGEEWRSCHTQLVSRPGNLAPRIKSVPKIQPRTRRAAAGDMTPSQVASLYRERIASGELGPGSSIVQVSLLAELHGVSTRTAKVAMLYLRREGLIQYSHTTHDWTVIEKPIPQPRTRRRITGRGTTYTEASSVPAYTTEEITNVAGE